MGAMRHQGGRLLPLPLLPRLVVELDGRPDGLIRTAQFEAAGYAGLRFWNNDVLRNPDGVLTSRASRLPC